MGGMSGEHEVSLASARSVMESLDRKKYQVVPIKIGRDGRWPKGLMILPQPNLIKFDIIIPMMHGTYGEDGKIQGLLELANVAYVGGNVLGSALAMDKILTKELLVAAGIRTPQYFWYSKYEYQRQESRCLKELVRKLGWPMFVKPSNLGSSVAISKVSNQLELKAAIRLALKYDTRVIIEKSIENATDVECSVLGNYRPRASLPGEVIPADQFYSYRDKYIDGKTRFVIPAALPKKTIKEIRELAVNVFKLLDLSGLARVDFLINKKNRKLYLNEVNTMPGFNKISMYPKMWQASGLPYEKLLDELIKLALEKHFEKNQLTTAFALGKAINV